MPVIVMTCDSALARIGDALEVLLQATEKENRDYESKALQRKRYKAGQIH